MIKMICLCGISGSGKTTWAKKFMTEHPDWLYFNPDDYYARINGDECDRRNVFEVWHALFRDVHTAALNNKNVLIDSNNLTFHQRMQWIEWFPEFEHILIIFDDVNLPTCFERVQKRKRTVSLDKMVKQIEAFEKENALSDKYYEIEMKYWRYILNTGGKDCDSFLAEALKR